MGRYAEWADYGAIFSGALSEEEFEAAIGAAEAYIDAETFGRAAGAQGYAKERLKAAACALAEQIARERADEERRKGLQDANMRAFEAKMSAFMKNNEAEAAEEAQLEQVTIDGYSEKYHIREEKNVQVEIGQMNENTARAKGADMAAWSAIVRKWLSGTGLVSAL